MIENFIYWTVRPEAISVESLHITRTWMLAAVVLIVAYCILERWLYLRQLANWQKLPKPNHTPKPAYGFSSVVIGAVLIFLIVRTMAANPDGVDVGPLAVRWYGLMFLIGFTVGYWIVSRMFRHEGAPEAWMPTLLIWVVAGTIIGARLGHCFFYEWDYYMAHPAEIIAFWKGGLASHGGTIGVILCVFGFSYFTTHRSALWTFDRLVPAIALVGCLIRLGNLFNSEIFGHATTLPWGFMFPLSREWQQLYGPDQACHPTQLYEAVCYLLLFVLLMWMYWRKNAQERPGLILGVFFIGIFLPRIIIEFVKNNQEAFEDGMLLNMGQILSVPFVLAGIWLVCRAMTRPRQHLTFPDRYADEPDSASRH